MIDIAKVHGWILYKRHCEQNQVSAKSRMTPTKFSTDTAHSLIHGKPDPEIPRSRPAKRSVPNKGDQRDKKVQLVKVPTPYADVRFDAMKYWPKEMPSLPSICTDYVYEMQHVTFFHFRTGLLQGLSEKVK